MISVLLVHILLHNIHALWRITVASVMSTRALSREPIFCISFIIILIRSLQGPYLSRVIAPSKRADAPLRIEFLQLAGISLLYRSAKVLDISSGTSDSEIREAEVDRSDSWGFYSRA